MNSEIDTTPGDHRKGPRRRGDVLYNAIFEATLDELTEGGYAELTMERVAIRARASKNSLYRRWPSRADLVAETIRHAIPSSSELPDTGDVREDILALLRHFAGVLDGPLGEAVRGLILETVRDPELMKVVHTRLTAAGGAVMLEVLRRGVARGEVRPTALTPRIATVGPDLLRQHFLIHGSPIPDRVLTEIVDAVVMPVIRP